MGSFLVSKENVVGLTRTAIAYVYAWLLLQFPAVHDFLHDLNLDEMAMATIVGTLLYLLVRTLAEKWGWLGYILIFNTKPAYADTPPANPDSI